MHASFKRTIETGSIESRKRRWRELLCPNSKPGFCFIVGGGDNTEPLPPPPPHWPKLAKERVERKWLDYRRALERSSWLDDDSIPSIDMMTGTEIFAEAFGCRVHRPDGTNPFALPLIHEAGEVSSLKTPELASSSLAYLFDMADELKRRAGPDAIFHLVDIQSPMDIAALIWEKSSFCMAMLEAPEAVKELAAKVHELLVKFLDEWFRRYGSEYVAHFPGYFMSGGMTLSEDEIGIVSSEAFKEFFLPELDALSRRYGGIGIHCCADAKHQWGGLRRVEGLRLLNLCNPPVRPPDYCRDAYTFFEDACAQWHMGWIPEGDAEKRFEGYPKGCRVVMDFQAKTRDEAQRLCARLQEARERISNAQR